MSVPLKTLCPQTSKDTPSATSLQVLEAGLMPSNLPDGPRRNLYGLDHAPVSRFRAREEDRDKMTPGIFGQLSSGLSPSAVLQRSLGSKLEKVLEGSGCPLYDLTWNKKIMPSGLPICRQRALEHRIPGKGNFGWPTPQAWDSVISYREVDMLRKERGETRPSGAKIGSYLGVDRRVVPHLVNGFPNPNLSRKLMGFPDSWSSCAPTEMP